ncbi:MAG: hypothetical protein U0359_10145 [Byssovorax sp.]
MKTLSIVTLLAAFAALSAACGNTPAASPDIEECQWPPGSPPAQPGTCPPKCVWNGTACEKDRGIIVDNKPKPAP